MTVLPGFIQNKKDKKHKIENLLQIKPSDLASKIFSAHVNKKEILYSSIIWIVIMNIIKIIPNRIFNKINF